MDRFKVSLGAGWFAAVPFVLLRAPDRWQWLACAMGTIIGAVLYQRLPTPPKA